MKNKKQANRGRSFEQLIEYANEWYRKKGIGLIQKIPTDWRVIRKWDGSIKKNVIISAFPVKKSTVDYIGLYYNRPIAFDAKSTENKTRFPLSNIEPHQREFLDHWRSLGGKAFYLIYFKEHNEIFILYEKQLQEFEKEHNRKSLPYDYFKKHCKQVEQEGTNPLHYLKTMF